MEPSIGELHHETLTRITCIYLSTVSQLQYIRQRSLVMAPAYCTNQFHPPDFEAQFSSMAVSAKLAKVLVFMLLMQILDSAKARTLELHARVAGELLEDSHGEETAEWQQPTSPGHSPSIGHGNPPGAQQPTSPGHSPSVGHGSHPDTQT